MNAEKSLDLVTAMIDLNRSVAGVDSSAIADQIDREFIRARRVREGNRVHSKVSSSHSNRRSQHKGRHDYEESIFRYSILPVVDRDLDSRADRAVPEQHCEEQADAGVSLLPSAR